MKILEINKFFYKKGGSEVYYFDVRALLASHGHEVMDFSMNSEKNEQSAYQKYFSTPVDFEHSEGLYTDFIKGLHLIYSFDAARNLENLIKEKGRPDVAHLHNFSYQLTPSIIRVLKKHKIPIVWTLHDYKVVSPNYNLFANGKIDVSTKPDKYFACVSQRCFKGSYLKSFLSAFEMWWHMKISKLYNQIDRYISPSKFLANLIVEWGVDKKKVSQLYNFLPLNEYKVRQEVGDYFLYVGRWTEEKGILPMLEVFKDLPDVKLKIVGQGDQEVVMRDYIKENQMVNVEMLGPIYPPKVFDLFSKAKALLVPSVWYENNPMTALQAMAFGVPVIGSNMGGLPELIDDNQTGLIFSADNFTELKDAVLKINSMSNDHNLIMGVAARRKVEGIADSEKHYRELIGIFEDVIS